MKPHVKAIWFLTAILLSQSGWAVSQNPLDLDDPRWTLSETVGPVSIFTRDYPHSNIKAFKARATIELPLAQILAAMAEPGSAALWIDKCLSATTLEGQTLSNRISHTVNSLPWPFSNRDIVAKVITTSPNSPNEILVNVTSLKDSRHSKIENTVRIESLNALYRLRAVSPSSTEFVWSQHTEPAGLLPDWLVNAKLIEIPSLSIPKLIMLASDERYVGAELIFDEQLHFKDVALANGLHISSLFPMLTEQSPPMHSKPEKH